MDVVRKPTQMLKSRRLRAMPSGSALSSSPQKRKRKTLQASASTSVSQWEAPSSPARERT